MTLKKALRFVLFPTWHMARAHDLFAMAEAWKAAAGDRAAEIDPALNAFHAIRDQPAFARAQDALAIHIERIFTLIGHEEINDHNENPADIDLRPQ